MVQNLDWPRSDKPAEHMEEDENTPKSLPRWVELEYMVRTIIISLSHGPLFNRT